MNKLSIIVPVYQNELNLEDTIPKLLSLHGKIENIDLELIFVDDGSTDKSFEILHKFFNLYKEIKILKLTKNFGQLYAVDAGLQLVTGDCVGIISADLQDDYMLFIDMYRLWFNGKKYVIAERNNREDNFLHQSFSNLYWQMVGKYAVKGYPKGGYDFFLIDRIIVNEVKKIREKNTHLFVLIFNLGFKPERIFYTRKNRTAGRSQWTFLKKVKLFLDTFIAFSYLPVRFISYAGIFFSFVSFIFGLLLILNKIIFGNPYVGWTSLVVLLSFIGGIIMLSLGIIGEYLWRILDEVRSRPTYVIEHFYQRDE